MSLRILHMGNVAGNAYNLAKGLRERTDVEADVFSNGYTYYLSQPEWEDADIDLIDLNGDAPVDWSKVDLKGFTRPSWYTEEAGELVSRALKHNWKDLARTILFVQSARPDKEQAECLREISSCIEQGKSPAGLLEFMRGTLLPRKNSGFRPGDEAWHNFLLGEFGRLCAPAVGSNMIPGDLRSLPHDLSAAFARYDIIQTYGAPHPSYPMLQAPAIPRVVFEHGTMRELPFENSTWGRQLALAYACAHTNVITNPDCLKAAARLGLSNYVYIPHPVDDDKFRPRQDPVFRAKLLNQYQAETLLFAPARQNWLIKGNDIMIRGFARLIKRVGPGPKLLLGGWGQEIARTVALIKELGLDDHIFMLPPLPKRLLARYYNAADIVLDQFLFGGFGTTAPEAMACAKPVLISYYPEQNAAAFPVPPPVCDCRTPEDIAETLERLLENPALCEQLGQDGKDWFCEHHSLDLVVSRHLDIYERILHSPGVVSVPETISRREGLSSSATVFINCNQPLDDSGKPGHLRTILGKNALQVVDARLKQLGFVRQVVLCMGMPEPETEGEARRLGWRVIHKSSPWMMLRQFPVRIVRDILRSDFMLRCSIDYPFLDPDLTIKWFSDLTLAGNAVAASRVAADHPYLPLRGMPKKAAVRLFCYWMCVSGDAGQWEECFWDIARHYGIIYPPALPDGIPRGSFEDCRDILEKLGHTNWLPLSSQKEK